MYIHRAIEKLIERTAKSFPAVVIYGPRQVGKSTTASYLYGDKYHTVTLDNAEDRRIAIENPRLFLETYPWPLIIDEIQKAPELMDEIKINIDKQKAEWLRDDEEQQLMYILTGSNRFELQKGIADSLAGRCGIIEMDSLSQAEKYGSDFPEFHPNLDFLRRRERDSSVSYRTRAQIFKDLFSGGMPDIVTGKSERELYYRSYMDTYIEKDVRQLIQASSEMQFRNFMSILALRTGQEVKYDKIASSIGIDARTCRQWMSILETSGIIYLLQPFMSNISKRIIKAPKLYFMDTGLCAYLCKWPSAEMLEKGAMGGAFFETYITSEIIKNLHAHGKDPKQYLFFYRDIDQKEIDLIYADSGKIYPIEIKKGIAPEKADKNFSVLRKYNLPIGTGIIIDCCDRMRPLNDAAWYYPAFLI